MSDPGQGRPWGPEGPSFEPQPGYGQQPYGQPPAYGRQPEHTAPGYPAPAGSAYGYQGPQTDGSAIAALLCAIGAFVVFPVVPAVVALFLARTAERNIRASNGARTGQGLVTAARVVSWVHLALALLAVLGIVLVIWVAVGNGE